MDEGRAVAKGWNIRTKVVGEPEVDSTIAAKAAIAQSPQDIPM